MRVVALAPLAIILAAPPASAQTLKADEVLSSISVRPLSEPNPVLGADGRVHLAYELLVANPGAGFVTIDQLDVIDESSRGLSSLAGDKLAKMTHFFYGSGNAIAPGGVGNVFMDVSLAPDQALPKSVAARITITRQSAGPDGKPAAFPAGQPIPATATFTAGATPVGKAARIIESPLRGSDWVAANGCCDTISSHRGAIMAVNGLMHAPERFAIDWIKISADNRMFAGDASKLASYAYYGAPVYSVADGVVVNLYDEADEQVPGAEPTGITPASIGGNMLVVDIGGGAYAFYAHLQRGSLKAKLGDRVTTGEVLGLVGNTGNSSGPHLHFHLMDGPSPLDANGLPYVFSSFSSRGTVADGQDDALLAGKAVTIDAARLGGQHVDQLPLNNQVVTFK
jgi:hypothetical protein